MNNPGNWTPEEKDAIDERIDHFFGFVQDILDEPSALEHLPHRAAIDLTPLEDREPGKEYLGETRHYAVSLADDRTRDQSGRAVKRHRKSA